MKKLLSFLVVALLTGCANGIPTPVTDQISESNQKNVKKIFVGIPFLLSIEATAVRLNENWMITAAHNKTILELTMKEAYYHPTCDIAVYRDNGIGYSEVSDWNFGDTLHNVGYPVGLPLSLGTGKYLTNTTNPNSEYSQCIMSATKGAIMVGMSGGGVYSESGKLVGILHGFNTEMHWENGEVTKDVTLFTSIWSVRKWLNEITGENYFE